MALVNVILMLFVHHHVTITEARLDVRVCCGMIGDNLPSPAAVVQLYRRYKIGKMRLFDPNAAALAALRGSGIGVTLGTKNQDLQSIASSSDVKITYLTAGNEVVPGDLAQYVLLAMWNLQSVVNSYGCTGVGITTVVATSTLGTSYPPNGLPLMINVFPYFVCPSDPANMSLDYAQFTTAGLVVWDGSLSYSNLLEAVVDPFYWAMEKEGVTGVGFGGF
ncbi:hypothetical protein ACJRO7_010309 [Eucalyptus globulus]|uniref:glucan endo-1,3-beta-D-glucosidase n=1 Tax=Eucalyptus globulus TaxID=34317 RepID=A0ABD3LBP4_EUCGL